MGREKKADEAGNNWTALSRPDLPVLYYPGFPGQCVDDLAAFPAIWIKNLHYFTTARNGMMTSRSAPAWNKTDPQIHCQRSKTRGSRSFLDREPERRHFGQGIQDERLTYRDSNLRVEHQCVVIHASWLTAFTSINTYKTTHR